VSRQSASQESSSTHPSLTLGVHHVGLSVPDLVRARRFFAETLGFRVVAERPAAKAVFVSDGSVLITLWEIDRPHPPIDVDRHRDPGLHHLALKVEPSTLDAMHSRVRASTDAVVDFAPEPLGDGPTRHMMCTVDRWLRLEFIAPAAS
jgi:catechol 2,3-dioxygenase-like lactoylglutathione lyase family enzyme